MIGCFVIYFAVMNMLFTAPAAPHQDAKVEANADNTQGQADNAALQEAVSESTTKPVEAETLSPSPSPKWTRNPDRKYVWIDVAIDDTYVGRITAELYSDLVPKTAENFRALTTGEMGPELSYKNSVCHRILTGFVVQCGDFTAGTGTGGRSIYGGKFDDEPNGLRLKHSKRYILQMANSGPNTNGSQFCFMLTAAPHLNGKHVVFGEVVEGFEVVDKMEAAGVADDGIKLKHKVALIDGGEIL